MRECRKEAIKGHLPLMNHLPFGNGIFKLEERSIGVVIVVHPEGKTRKQRLPKETESHSVRWSTLQAGNNDHNHHTLHRVLGRYSDHLDNLD